MLTARLLGRFGPKPLIVGGLLVLAVGLLWVAAVEPTGTFVVEVGSALGLAALTALATSQRAGELGDLPALTDGFRAAFLAAAARPQDESMTTQELDGAV